MKEKEIMMLVKKFEKVMGPVASRIAKETALSLGILKGDKISPPSKEDYEKFVDTVLNEYSKIVGKKVVQTIAKL